MESIESVLEKEAKFLDLFGFNFGPRDENYYFIYDGDGKEVGYLELDKESQQEYSLLINCPSMYCKRDRSMEDEFDFNYTINIKGNDGNDYYVMSYLGDLPNIRIWCNNNFIANLDITYQKLIFWYDTSNQFYTKEEFIEYKKGKNAHEEEYAYQITTCPRGKELDKTSESCSRSIEWKYNPVYPYCHKKNQLTRTVREFRGQECHEPKQELVKGNIEEIALKDGHAVRCFNEVRMLINSIVPVRKDFISAVVSPDLIEEREIGFLFNAKNDLYVFDLIPKDTSLELFRELYHYYFGSLLPFAKHISGGKNTEETMRSMITPETIEKQITICEKEVNDRAFFLKL